MDYIRREYKAIIALVVIIGFFIWLAFWSIGNISSENRSFSVDIYCGTVLFLSVIIALLAYLVGRRNDEYQIAEKRRDYFIKDENLNRIGMLMGHNNIKLQTVVAIANIMEVRQPGLMTDEAMKLRQNFDNYLNFMESVAILANRGSIIKESLEGLWTYYFKQLRKTHLMEFSKDKHPILESQIIGCINELYKDNPSTGKLVKAEFQKYFDGTESTVNDPIEKKRNKVDIEINPIARPIWYYVNRPEFEFIPIQRLMCQLYSKEDKYLKLDSDGF